MTALKRTEAIKLIRRWTITLNRAIQIYNYLTCYGETRITKNDIESYFNN